MRKPKKGEKKVLTAPQCLKITKKSRIFETLKNQHKKLSCSISAQKMFAKLLLKMRHFLVVFKYCVTYIVVLGKEKTIKKVVTITCRSIGRCIVLNKVLFSFPEYL